MKLFICQVNIKIFKKKLIILSLLLHCDQEENYILSLMVIEKDIDY